MARSLGGLTAGISFLAALAALASAIVPACYDAPMPACGFACGPGGACPAAYTCAADQRCHLHGAANACGADAMPDAADAPPSDSPEGIDGPRPDAPPDAAPDAMPDAAPDAMPDAAPDAMPDAAPDAMPDAA